MKIVGLLLKAFFAKDFEKKVVFSDYGFVKLICYVGLLESAKVAFSLDLNFFLNSQYFFFFSNRHPNSIGLIFYTQLQISKQKKIK